IAVLSGQETPEELSALANDIFLYFGLGCRNVSKLYLPAGYPFYQLTEAYKQFEDYLHHNHFRNNYDYYKTIFLMNNQAFIDGGFYIMQENALLHNPVAVVHYEYYSDLSEVQKFVSTNQENLQCIVGNLPGNIAATPFGKAQQPELWDYADNIDTIEFLQKL
ncbi:MAG: acyl-CoA reductase, partial [Bacteroidota bacterium]